MTPDPSRVDAILLGDEMRWNYGSALGTPVSLTYIFPSSIPAYYQLGDPELNHFQPFAASEVDGARRALAQFAEVANITFSEVGYAGTLVFATDQVDPAIQAYTYYPDLSLPSWQRWRQGDVWLNNYWSDNLDQSAGSYGYATMLHEIGHAIGLKHSFEAEFGHPALPPAEDNRRFSVMSYTANPLAGVEPSTLMLYDIAAVQKLYGANMSTRAGDSVYSWTNGAAVVATIWDGGGTDTIDASNQTGASTIDLREGAFSSIGAYSQDIAIAYGAQIENASGGSASDLLIGNDLANVLHGNAGNDVLTGLNGADFLDGGTGSDTLAGGAGADVFLLASSGADVDQVQDFTLGEDRLALSASAFGLSATGTLGAAGVELIRGATALSTAPTLLYNGDAVSWDADGTGASAPVLLAHVTVLGDTPFPANTDDLLWRRDADGLTQASLNANGSSTASTTVGTMAGWDLLSVGDFNHDGIDDLLWQRQSDRYTAASLMSDGLPVSSPKVGVMPGWELLGTGDFNADGTTDLLWRRLSDGHTADSLMSNGLPAASPTVGSMSGWELLGTGDFNADGTTDLLWRRPVDGYTAASLMSHGLPAASPTVGWMAGWDLIGTGDFNADGTADLLWQRQSDGYTAASLMSHGLPAASPTVGWMTGWDLIGTGDFNGDGTDDLLWQRQSDGYTAASLMSNGLPAASPMVGSMSGWELLGTGDFNADGVDDLLWRRQSDGHTAASLMTDGLPAASPTIGDTSDWSLLAIGDFGTGHHMLSASDWTLI